jgi:acetyltransferase-like isoleucine patch superfamily enzyme
LTIGSSVNIAGEVRIFTAEHEPSSPTFEGEKKPVSIGDYVYIGSRVTILPGASIGEGAVVASGAVVAGEVAPWTMVGGVPAKFIKSRPVVKYTLNTKQKMLFQ